MILRNGLEVRFQYDDTKLQPSNLSTNEATKNASEYFQYVDEFKTALDFLVKNDTTQENIIKAAIQFSPPVEPNGKHITTKEGIDGVVLTTTPLADDEDQDGVLLGRMSFKMLSDTINMDKDFKLVTNESKDIVPNGQEPRTGIKINLDAVYCYEAQSTFRFTEALASKDATLTDLVVSSGEKDDDDTESSNYKEYDLTPKFDPTKKNYELTLLENIDTIDITATQTDKGASMKIKVPVRDSDGNLVYDSDEIQYIEKELKDKTAMEVTLNKLGEPDTKITVLVTAEDGNTKEEYELVIKRPYGIIKGSVYLPPMSSTNTHIANIRAYKSSNVNKLFTDNSLGDWDTVQSNVTASGDNVHDLLLTLDGIEDVTNEDGTYEIYVIPGTYDIMVDQTAYLDAIYISKTVAEGETLNLGEYSLYAGDLDKSGLIDISDYLLIGNAYNTVSTDSNYVVDYDFDPNEGINISELMYFANNYLKTREVIK